MNSIIVKNTEKNMTPVIRELLCNLENNTVLEFEKGEYHFYPEGSYVGTFYPSNNGSGVKNVVFYINDKNSITIKGNDSTFVFHGEISPFIVENSQEIIFEDFKVDFATPQAYQAEVIEACDDYLELYVDKSAFPYAINDNKLYFQLEKKDEEVSFIYLFNTDGKREKKYRKDPVRYNMAYLILGDNNGNSRFDIGNEGADNPRYMRVNLTEEKGNIRFIYKPNTNKMFYDKGDKLVLHFKRSRDNDTFFINNCINTKFNKITIYRGSAMGIIAQLCENIEISQLYIGTNPKRKDLVTTTADGFMVVDCSGKIILRDSYIGNTLDDGFNSHSTYMLIDKVFDNKIIAKFAHHEKDGFVPFRKDDKIQISDGEKSVDIARLTVKSAKLYDGDINRIIIECNEPISDNIKENFVLYNLDLSPELEFVGNEFYNVPALLFASSRKAYFSRNKITTRLEALRMKDSMAGTKEYEMKRISNLTVEDNEFVNCCEWYDDYLISIGRFAGEDRPKALLHKNIILRNNKFSGNNPKLFNLECCENVVIEGNEYINSKTEVSELGVSPIKLSYCKNIQLDNNLLKF